MTAPTHLATPSRLQNTHSSSDLSSATQASRWPMAENEVNPVANAPPEVYSKSRRTIHYFEQLVVKPLVCLLVLATLVASKVSIAIMLARLHAMASFDGFSNTTISSDDQDRNTKTAIRLYWQLLIILAFPNLITWVRSLFNGIIGKSATQPWPKKKAIIGVSKISSLHVHNSRL